LADKKVISIANSN